MAVVASISIASSYDPKADLVLGGGNCLELLAQIPSETVQLVVSSPSYDIGKPYETHLHLEQSQ